MCRKLVDSSTTNCSSSVKSANLRSMACSNVNIWDIDPNKLLSRYPNNSLEIPFYEASLAKGLKHKQRFERYNVKEKATKRQ